MKTHLAPSILAAVTAALLTGTSAQAQITGINAASSSASLQFDDTNSSNGITLLSGGTTTVSTGPSWNGSLFTNVFPFDPNTLDTAQGDISAAFAGNSYAINFANVMLTQPFLSTKGFALLIFNFYVEYQLGAAGLPSQATLFPAFIVSGTVQPGPIGFASVNGSIIYHGVIAPAPPGATPVTLDTVNYAGTYSGAGPFFNATVPSFPTVGTTPALEPNTTFTVSGTMTFTVDPAEINATSVTVPEPSTALLALLSLPLLLARRRFRA